MVRIYGEYSEYLNAIRIISLTPTGETDCYYMDLSPTEGNYHNIEIDIDDCGSWSPYNATVRRLAWEVENDNIGKYKYFVYKEGNLIKTYYEKIDKYQCNSI